MRMRTLSVQPAGVAGERADGRPDDDREADRQEPDPERDVRAPWTTRLNTSRTLPSMPEDVLRLVGRAAQQVDARRRPLLDAGLDAEEHRLGRVVGRDQVGEDRDEHEERRG